MATNYKQAKEDFVSGMTGSSITHINLISLVALASVSLYSIIRTRINPSRKIGLFFSWTVLVFPVLLSMTSAANHPLYFNALLFLTILFVARIPRAESGTPLPSSQLPSPSVEAPRLPVSEEQLQLSPLPALTTYRGHMMLITILAILAVDFPVFPRSLGKCETFGVSLMDLGVGSFVFSQGIVSAIPLVKDVAYLRAPFFSKFLKVTTKSLPIIALGVVRVLLVKGTEYPEHVTEYGVHWNFFITLALLPIFQVMLHPLFARMSITLVGVLIAVAQELLLNQFKLKEYVLSAPRTSLISQNKEGVVSLLGYLSIQILGLSIGTIILSPTPSFFTRRQKAFHKLEQDTASHGHSQISNAYVGANSSEKESLTDIKASNAAAPRQLDKTATELCAYAIMWWGFVAVARLTEVDGKWSEGNGGVSRRMVNISYILWIAAFNVSFLLCYVCVLDLWIFSENTRASGASGSQMRAKKSIQKQVYDQDGIGSLHIGTTSSHLLQQSTYENPPSLLEIINRNGLMVFLLANVLTGLVNLTMSTMYMSDWHALLVLSCYSMACCAVPWFLIKRKTRAFTTKMKFK